MIELYTHGTPNGRKVAIMLEEIGLDYRTIVVDIINGNQFDEKFVALNPNSKIPVLVDKNGPEGRKHVVFESGAILLYLAEKTESPLLPINSEEKSQVMQWLMFQLANVGPMFGQYHHFFSHAREKVPYALGRYREEVERLYAVMDNRLSVTAYFAGPRYSIADISMFPWVARFEDPSIDLTLRDYENLSLWYDSVFSRPAVLAGMEI